MSAFVAPSPRKIISSPTSSRKNLPFAEQTYASSPNFDSAQKELMGIFTQGTSPGKEEEEEFMDPTPPSRSFNPLDRNSPFLLFEEESSSPHIGLVKHEFGAQRPAPLFKKPLLPTHLVVPQEEPDDSMKSRSNSAPVSPRTRYESV